MDGTNIYAKVSAPAGTRFTQDVTVTPAEKRDGTDYAGTGAIAMSTGSSDTDTTHVTVESAANQDSFLINALNRHVFTSTVRFMTVYIISHHV